MPTRVSPFFAWAVSPQASPGPHRCLAARRSNSRWPYRRLFSHRSIWRRRPADPAAVLPYLAMSYLYKRSNRFWYFLIRHKLTGLVWSPLVEWTSRRHIRFRAKLAGRVATAPRLGPAVIAAGV